MKSFLTYLRSTITQVAAQLGAGIYEAIFTVIGAMLGGTMFMLSESALDSPKKADPT